MEKSEIKKIIYLINSVYPKTNIKPDEMTLDVWNELLIDFTFSEVKQSVMKLSKKMKFVPTVHEIIDNINREYTVSKAIGKGGIIYYIKAHTEKIPFRFHDPLEAQLFMNFIEKQPTWNEIYQEYIKHIGYKKKHREEEEKHESDKR